MQSRIKTLRITLPKCARSMSTSSRTQSSRLRRNRRSLQRPCRALRTQRPSKPTDRVLRTNPLRSMLLWRQHRLTGPPRLAGTSLRRQTWLRARNPISACARNRKPFLAHDWSSASRAAQNASPNATSTRVTLFTSSPRIAKQHRSRPIARVAPIRKRNAIRPVKPARIRLTNSPPSSPMRKRTPRCKHRTREPCRQTARIG